MSKSKRDGKEMRSKDFQYYFAGFVPLEDKLLIISYENLLLEFNLADSTLHFIQNMNSEICREMSNDRVEQLIWVEDSLVIVSMWGQKVYVYDLEEDRWQDLDIDCHQKGWGNFLEVFGRKQYLYIVPRYRKHIIKIDTKAKQISRLECPLMSQIDIENVVTCVKDDTIYFFDGTNHHAFGYNLSADDYTCVGIQSTLEKIAAVQYYKNLFFLLYESGRTIIWDEQDNTLETIIDPINGSQPNYFGQLAVTAKDIWLLPALGEDIYIYNFENKLLRRYEDYPKELKYLNLENYYKYVPGKRYKDKIYFGMHSANHILCINANTKEEWFCPKLPPMEEAAIFRRCHGLCVQEREAEISLSGFLNEIPQVEEDGAAYVWRRKTIGDAIWKTLKE